MNNESKLAIANLILAGFYPTGNRSENGISFYSFNCLSETEVKQLCPSATSYSYQEIEEPTEEHPGYEACVYVDINW